MKMHIKILGAINLITLVSACYNSYEEDLQSTLFFAGTVIAAIASGILMSAIFLAIRRLSPRQSIPFEIAAYLSTSLGCLAYFGYALNGKSDSLHSAAHMHVIMFPILHAAFSLLLLVLATIVWGVMRVDPDAKSSAGTL